MRFFPLFNDWFGDVPREDLEHPDPLEDIAEEKVDSIVESLARSITDKGLAYPASVFLHISRPLCFVASQGVLIVSPFLSPFIGEGRVNTVSAFLGRRANVRKLAERLEQMDAEDRHRRSMQKRTGRA